MAPTGKQTKVMNVAAYFFSFNFLELIQRKFGACTIFFHPPTNVPQTLFYPKTTGTKRQSKGKPTVTEREKGTVIKSKPRT
jgi:hypothetical protein